MEAQFVRLLTMARQPRVTLQLLPFAAGSHPGLAGSFVLLGFDDPADWDVAVAKSVGGEAEIEAAEQIASIRLMWDRIVAAALPPDDSLSRLTRLAGG